jgi:hypothetical protein
MKLYPNTIINYFFILLIIFIISNSGSFAQRIVINELMASNASTIADEDGDFPDWIELYNYGDTVVHLEGYGLSDNVEDPFRWRFGNVTIYPDEYMLIWASGKDRQGSIIKPATIIPERSVWKYLDDGSDQGSAWRYPDFDDDNWPSGLGMFGYGGSTRYGTILDYGPNPNNKHITSYFRKQFTLSDIENFEALELTLMVDDGAIVYVNGHEVVRENLPIGQINYNTRALNTIVELSTTIHKVNKYFFTEGQNVIAVEVHQIQPTSSDLRFDLSLKVPGNLNHTNFSLKSEGETVLLSNTDGEVISKVASEPLQTDISYGRYPNGTGDFNFYANPTPGLANSSEYFTQVLSPPAFSHVGGFYKNPFSLTLTSDDPEATIIYTIDGSNPDPHNLDGKTYQYKNQYAQMVYQPRGELLTGEYRSFLYDQPFVINDLTTSPDRLSRRSSTWHAFPDQVYFPMQYVHKGRVVRAIAIKDNAIPSSLSTHTYLFSVEERNPFNLPVISLSMNEDALFDYYTGIYTAGRIFDNWRNNVNTNADGNSPGNYYQRGEAWERPAHIEIFETNSKYASLHQDIGVRIHGGWTRHLFIKSLRLYARNSYGDTHLQHRFFPELTDSVFKRLVLRNAGNDFDQTYFRDAAIQKVFHGLNIDTQAYRPFRLYINGEYWGVHNVRERYDKHYLERVYGVDPNNIDLLERNMNVVEGDNNHYEQTINYININGVQAEHHYNFVKSRIDIENFIDYQIANIFARNHDWPGNNIKYWRVRKDTYDPDAPYGHDGRWRWMLFDTEFGFGIWNTSANENTLAFATRAGLQNWPNPDWSTFLLRSMLQNHEFRNNFVNRFADLLNTRLTPIYITNIINELKREIEPEMPDHIARWRHPQSMSAWNNNIMTMINFVGMRPYFQLQHINSYFNLQNFVLTVNVNDPAMGYVRVNTIDLVSETQGVGEQPYPWVGQYFRGIPIDLAAIPKQGFSFSRWQGAESSASAAIAGSFNNNTSLTAHFQKSELIHYWHFNSIPNQTFEIVYSDLGLLNNATVTYAGSGEGYMDRVSDNTLINSDFPSDSGYALRVRNPSDTKQLILHLPTDGFKNIILSYACKRTPNGATAQRLYYRVRNEGDWIPASETFTITEEYQRFAFHFNDPQTYDNPEFAVSIRFLGEEAGGSSGNNRYDNIKLEGIPVTMTSSMEDPTYLDKQNSLIIFCVDNKLLLPFTWEGRSLLQIIDMKGSLLKSFDIQGPEPFYQHLSLQPGVYLFRIFNKTQHHSVKIIITN